MKFDSLAGLECFPDIEELWIHATIGDLGSLGTMTGLTSLVLRSGWHRGVLTNLDEIAGLVNLQTLTVTGHQLRNIDAVAGFHELTQIHLAGNELTDISALRGLSSLRTVNVSGNRITTLDPLSDNPSLESLFAHDNAIADLSELRGLPVLGWLDLRNNRLADLDGVQGFLELRVLDVSENRLHSIASRPSLPLPWRLELADNPGLDAGELPWLEASARLRIDRTATRDFAWLARTPRLSKLHANRLDLASVGISGMEHSVAIEFIGLDDCGLESFAGLETMGWLTFVSAEHNRIAELGGLDEIPKFETSSGWGKATGVARFCFATIRSTAKPLPMTSRPSKIIGSP